jgi:hypothetical protein
MDTPAGLIGREDKSRVQGWNLGGQKVRLNKIVNWI